MTRKRRSAAQHGLVERRIRFKVHQRPHHDRSIIVTLPRTELIDTRRAAAIVALREGIPLEDVRIVSIGNRPTPGRVGEMPPPVRPDRAPTQGGGQ